MEKLVKIYCQAADEMKKEEQGSNCTAWPCEVTVIRSSVMAGLENDNWTSWAYSPLWLKRLLIVK